MRTAVRGAIVMACAALAGGCVATGEATREARLGVWLQEGEPGGDAGAAEQEAWMKAATPGAPHAQLAKMAGKWTLDASFVQAPGSEEMKSSAKAEFETIMGGRFVTQEVEGEMMGMPFEGLGMSGYDNLKKQYVSVWADSMGTMIMVSYGTSSDGGKTITFKSEMQNPMDGKTIPLRLVETFVSDDTHTLEMYCNAEDGTEFRTMLLTYTRVKAAGATPPGGTEHPKSEHPKGEHPR